jgi:hypothetical protein
MRSWKDLPNARHIDWVIASVKQHPKIWAPTSLVGPIEARNTAYIAAWSSGRAWMWDTAVTSMAPAPLLASDAILAIISYDDCAHLLDMPSEQLKTWIVLTEHPAAALLLPAVIAREQIAQLERA